MSIKNCEILRFGIISEDKAGELLFSAFYISCDDGRPDIALLKLVVERINSEIAQLEEKGDE